MLKIDRTVVMPYWDWSQYDHPDDDPIWRTFRRPGSNVCLNDEVYDNHQFRTPNPHCLTRGSGQTTANFFKDPYIKYLFKSSTSFQDFSSKIENGHNLVHNYVGGDMGLLSSSPNDILFYLHHGFVDYLIFMIHKIRRPQFFQGLDVNIPQWDVHASDIMDTTSLCYIYYPRGSEFEGNVGTIKYSLNDYMNGPTNITNITAIEPPDALPDQFCALNNMTNMCNTTNQEIKVNHEDMVQEIKNGSFDLTNLTQSLEAMFNEAPTIKNSYALVFVSMILLLVV